MLRRFSAALAVGELVLAEAKLAGAAVDEWICEAADVARCLPHSRVEDDRRIEGDDVVSLAQHRPQPELADVVAQQDAVVPVVVGRPEAAVDLGGREDEAPPPAERDDLVHGHVCRLGHALRLSPSTS